MYLDHDFKPLTLETHLSFCQQISWEIYGSLWGVDTSFPRRITLLSSCRQCDSVGNRSVGPHLFLYTEHSVVSLWDSQPTYDQAGSSTMAHTMCQKYYSLELVLLGTTGGLLQQLVGSMQLTPLPFLRNQQCFGFLHLFTDGGVGLGCFPSKPVKCGGSCPEGGFWRRMSIW